MYRDEVQRRSHRSVMEYKFSPHLFLVVFKVESPSAGYIILCFIAANKFLYLTQKPTLDKFFTELVKL